LAFCSIDRAQESARLKAQEHVLRVNVDLALLNVTVSDPQGRFVNGLG
jgi:hypothetical protein